MNQIFVAEGLSARFHLSCVYFEKPRESDVLVLQAYRGMLLTYAMRGMNFSLLSEYGLIVPHLAEEQNSVVYKSNSKWNYSEERQIYLHILLQI